MRIEWRDPAPLTQADLAPYFRVINNHINQIMSNFQAEQFQREGSYMTITAEKTTTQFKVGDRVRAENALMPSERDYEGVIIEFTGEESCLVAAETPVQLRVGFLLSSLVPAAPSRAVTLDTPDGTVVRLVSNHGLLASKGALAVVDRSLGGDSADWLIVRWLSGHLKDGRPQASGEYGPSRFELAYVEGDTVCITGNGGPYHYLVIGSVATVKGTYNDRLTVIGENYSGSLVRQTVNAQSVEPYTINEDEFQEINPAPVFAEGDVVVITDATYLRSFIGKRLRVLGEGPYDNPGKLWLDNAAIDQREDGSKSNFFWPADQLRAFDPATDFQVGDLVEAKYLVEWASGVVTRLEGDDFRGDIEINWTSGPDYIVNNKPLGMTRANLRLVGRQEGSLIEHPTKVGQRVVVIDPSGSPRLAKVGQVGVVTSIWGYNKLTTIKVENDGPTVEMFAKRFKVIPAAPVFAEYEDFDFEAGQEIASADVLNELPNGTVLYAEEMEHTPYIKVQDAFVRVNQFTTRATLAAGGPSKVYDETDTVTSRVNRDDIAVIIGYVPTA